MTHDELLAKINKMNDWDEFDPAYRERWEKNAHKKHKAIRAVVELHKPGRITMDTNEIICAGCDAGNNYYSDTYPCSTIKAIEKELE